MKNLDVGKPAPSTWHTAASSALRKCRAGSGVAGARRLPFPLESGENNVAITRVREPRGGSSAGLAHTQKVYAALGFASLL